MTSHNNRKDTTMKRFSFPKLTLWRIIGVILIAAGAFSAIYRFAFGLGASTNLSDECPWGLWIGFNILGGVGLAAGGFTVCAAVHLFNIERFKPMLRPAVLTAFLGYLLVICALLLELGRPLRVWHTMIMWNRHSVLFEVSWCVMLYTSVLTLEFSPVILERLKFTKLLKLVEAITIPLVIVGVLLSTLHQSSLGSLYLIVPNKLHPFWYSPMLPIFFFLSAIAIGGGMTIVESFLSARAFNRRLELPLLREIARIMVVILLVYATAKVVDFGRRGVFPMMFDGSLQATFLWIELSLFIFVPVTVFSIPKRARNQTWLFVGAVSAVLGFLANRLNVGITGIDPTMRAGYFPAVMELSTTLGILAFGCWMFSLAVKYLAVFPEHHEAIRMPLRTGPISETPLVESPLFEAPLDMQTSAIQPMEGSGDGANCAILSVAEPGLEG